MVYKIFFVVTAYFIGSIPFGVLVAKTKGIDLRSVGSRNIGATNVLRSLGKLPAIITLLGDSLKGALVVLLCRLTIGDEFWEGLTGVSAILGHIYSMFLSFKGGKGVATGFGVLLVYSPLETLIAMGVWIATVLYSRYSSLGAVISYAALPLVFILSGADKTKTIFAAAISVLIILKHRENIKRLLEGTESRIGEKRRD
ncbi:MAG: glycerol-3-phosphate 1-O-acyltransferase PlsY [Nitrospirae bacterium]|nr:glycerol-3-phosphate 1-O-acyltransferase PlsY [Nitrospirota bacterium]